MNLDPNPQMLPLDRIEDSALDELLDDNVPELLQKPAEGFIAKAASSLP